jgi:hypothetical protein
VEVKKGEEAILLPKRSAVSIVLEPVSNDKSGFNSYGVKKGQQLKNDQFWKE